MFCVFSGIGVQRLRLFLNTNRQDENREPSFGDNEGTMFHEGEDTDVILNVTAQANGMVIDELDEEFGNDSEMLGLGQD